MSLQVSSQPQLHIRINVLKATRLYWELGCLLGHVSLNMQSTQPWLQICLFYQF